MFWVSLQVHTLVNCIYKCTIFGGQNTKCIQNNGIYSISYWNCNDAQNIIDLNCNFDYPILWDMSEMKYYKCITFYTFAHLCSRHTQKFKDYIYLGTQDSDIIIDSSVWLLSHLMSLCLSSHNYSSTCIIIHHRGELLNYLAYLVGPLLTHTQFRATLSLYSLTGIMLQVVYIKLICNILHKQRESIQCQLLCSFVKSL